MLPQVLRRTFLIVVVSFAAYLFVLPKPYVEASSVGTPCHAYARSAATIEEALFGVSMPLPEGGAVLVESNRVPLVPGTTFAWRAQLADPFSPVRLTEELILPEPPQLWWHTDKTRISADRRVATTDEFVAAVDGWIGNAWQITEGDPEGEYVLRIHLDGTHVRTFRFLVGP